MEEGTITVTLTIAEAKALFMECACCSPYDELKSGQRKIYKELRKAGEYND